ncbi:hypothetical protein FQN57_001823 [Myotisia sp. PD_48]|nr:hypothetical protein FQN57_001823 [Myotisia sp. PD_48]
MSSSEWPNSQSLPAGLAAAPKGSLPGIAALFLIRFDIRTGYSIVWKQSIPDVTLEDAVEFKSLPSGLHNVDEDLVYFVHNQYAGLSAFYRKPSNEANRNAVMISVGVLVPLSHGRLGRSWKHAAGLKDLALYGSFEYPQLFLVGLTALHRQLAGDLENTQPLSEYWDTFQMSDEDVSPPDSPLAFISNTKPAQLKQRQRAPSEATALINSNHILPPFHPALTLPESLNTFGPLLFPLYRAALLKKRILLLGEAPIEMSCNFVYNLSLLSSLPHTLLPLLPSNKNVPNLKPWPLFNVGLHDMGSLASSSGPNSGWIACSTDTVLSVKPQLFDLLVELPPHHSKNATEKAYPGISLSVQSSPISRKNGTKIKPLPVKATQRDTRRFLTLRDKLKDFHRLGGLPPTARDDSDNSSTFSSSSIVEPISWPLLAYTSFIWWASAGEKGAGPSDEEADQDARLLLREEDKDVTQSMDSGSYRRESIHIPDTNEVSQEIAIITYFRRLTTQIFSTLFDIISRQDENGDYESGYSESSSVADLHENEYPGDGFRTRRLPSGANEASAPLLPSSSSDGIDDDDDAITIKTSDITDMGLDPWSDADKAFVEELVHVWWGRKAHFEGAHIHCCGIRIL